MTWMIEEIVARGGFVYFDEYMELALYHPVHGYYSSERPRYGRGGDFLTAPTASPWYGRVMARLFKKLAKTHGRILLADLASGDGSFLVNLLKALGKEAVGTIAKIVAVEQSPAMRRLCIEKVEPLCAPGISFSCVDRIDRDRPSAGLNILHASELFDALPVARILMGEEGPEELLVGIGNQELSWLRRPARPVITAYLDTHGIKLVQGQLAEVNLRAEPLYRRILAWAKSPAMAFILDYGYESRRLYDPRGKPQGSLACYFRHELSRDPLLRPGEQDLTAHINWNDLYRGASAEGWRKESLQALAAFLYHAGIGKVVEELGLGMEAELTARTVAERQELKRLLDPEGMGSDLKLLVQSRMQP